MLGAYLNIDIFWPCEIKSAKTDIDELSARMGKADSKAEARKWLRMRPTMADFHGKTRERP